MIVPSLNELKAYWTIGQHKEVAKFLPYFMDSKDPFVMKLQRSNLLTLKEKIELPSLTFGADPEFILCEKGKPENIVMFSSKYTGNKFGISEAEIGADYGLLEFRVQVGKNPKAIVDSVAQLHTEFGNEFPLLELLKKEAIKYNHERARLKDELEVILKGAEAPSYGGYHGKNCSVWSTNSVDTKLVLDDTVEISLSAYGKPEFKKYAPDILSAGGHIHLGGTFIKALSIPQLNEVIKQLDASVLPLCKTVETEAATLREVAYGSPGEYRLKEYGIEYRSPSNAIFFPENSQVLLQVLTIIESTVKGYFCK